MPIESAVADVRAAIADACQAAGRLPSDVTLIAVTKSQGPEVLAPLSACGITEVGENRVDHLHMMQAAAPSTLRFHHIGRIQSRQIPHIVAHADVVHGLCERAHVERLDRAAAEAGKNLAVFIQVNTSGEAAKAGVSEDELSALVDAVSAHAHLSLAGLMTMAPELDVHGDEAAVRACFAGARELAQRHGINRLSMGMSGDFRLAIAEGATDIRIGTRLFV